MIKTTKCRFCSAPSVAIFELVSHDGFRWQAPLCVEDALLLQNQGYNVHVLKKEKVGENEEGKEKENEEI